MTDTQHHTTVQEPGKDANTRSARYQRWVASTERLLDILAVVFLLVFLAGRLDPSGPAWWQPTLDLISLAIWFAFAVDYVVRLSLSVHRWIFVKTHKLDLVMVALPMLRMLRVVLLLRKSFRSISTERIASSLISIVVVIVVAGAFLEWRVEHNAPGANITTFGTALWWSIVTTTTVGYGDTYPVTTAGRLIGSVIMVVGIGLIGTVSATVAAWFVSHKQRIHDDASQALAAKAQAARADVDNGGAAGVVANPVGDQRNGEIGTAGRGTPAPAAVDTLSLTTTLATLSAQIELLTRQQAELQSTITRLADQRAG
jgi:voltage-gated potassium channel